MQGNADPAAMALTHGRNRDRERRALCRRSKSAARSSTSAPICSLSALVIYEMVTGQRGFPGENSTDIHEAILHRVPQSVRKLNPLVLGDRAGSSKRP